MILNKYFLYILKYVYIYHEFEKYLKYKKVFKYKCSNTWQDWTARLICYELFNSRQQKLHVQTLCSAFLR